MTDITQKLCSHCKDVKGITNFSKQRASRDGLQAYCKPCVKIKNDSYYLANENKILKYKKQYRKNNRVKMSELQRTHRGKNYNRHLARMSNDPLYKSARNLRGLIYHSLKRYGYTKKSKTYRLLGADFEVVIQHLINTAIRNYGTYDENQEYHIDHIIPCSAAKNQDELETLQFYYNLQYLKPEDNLAKGDKLDWSPNPCRF